MPRVLLPGRDSDRAILGLLIGCGLARSELAGLEVKMLQQKGKPLGDRRPGGERQPGENGAGSILSDGEYSPDLELKVLGKEGSRLEPMELADLGTLPKIP